MAGGAALSGIGFTISPLIVDLALGSDEVLADQARTGVLAASITAFVLAWRCSASATGSPAYTGGTPTALVPPVDLERDRLHPSARAVQWRRHW